MLQNGIRLCESTNSGYWKINIARRNRKDNETEVRDKNFRYLNAAYNSYNSTLMRKYTLNTPKNSFTITEKRVPFADYEQKRLPLNIALCSTVCNGEHL